MMNYNLQALLRLRTHKRTLAEGNLRIAYDQHDSAQKELNEIENTLENTLHARNKLQEDFFTKASTHSSNKREVICHVSSSRKNSFDEAELRKLRASQQEIVKSAAHKLEIAKAQALDAERNLKAIEKHHVSWQRRLRRDEEIKEECALDDQNCVRYFLRKA